MIPLDPSSGNSRISPVFVWHAHDMFSNEFRVRLSWIAPSGPMLASDPFQLPQYTSGCSHTFVSFGCHLEAGI